MTANPQELRDQGMASVENGTDPRLILTVDALIAEFNEMGRDWSANDLRDRLPVVPPALIGARVKAATMRKPMEMRRVGWVLSDLPSTKSKPIGLYRGATHADTLFDEAG
jgi:hypothetical protein